MAGPGRGTAGLQRESRGSFSENEDIGVIQCRSALRNTAALAEQRMQFSLSPAGHFCSQWLIRPLRCDATALPPALFRAGLCPEVYIHACAGRWHPICQQAPSEKEQFMTLGDLLAAMAKTFPFISSKRSSGSWSQKTEALLEKGEDQMLGSAHSLSMSQDRLLQLVFRRHRRHLMTCCSNYALRTTLIAFPAIAVVGLCLHNHSA
ncbi:uncharacterized protein [Struthio camelus]|uniref:uncharacterized protein n=1 Tax=Struthio camelus TaxID=8801 RepID=UPI0036040674